MGRHPRWLTVFCVLLWTARASLAAETSPPFTCVPVEDEPSLRVCRQFDGAKKGGVGDTAVWRIWVEGTREPVEVRLHNSSPSVVQLEDGPDQIVRLKAGRDRAIQRKVVYTSAGTSFLSVRAYARDPVREAGRIAGVLVEPLQKTQAEFRERWSHLPTTAGPAGSVLYASGAVEGLLAQTREALLGALNYPELAAMRDAVDDELRQAAESLHAAASTGNRTGRSPAAASFAASPATRLFPTAVFAASRKPAAGKPVPKESADSVLDSVGTFLENLSGVAERRQLLLDLCVVSKPAAGAVFTLHPRLYEKAHETATTGLLVNIYRGSYVYTIKNRRGRGVIRCEPERNGSLDCVPLDLLMDVRPVLECDFDMGVCKRLEEPLPAECQRKDH